MSPALLAWLLVAVLAAALLAGLAHWLGQRRRLEIQSAEIAQRQAEAEAVKARLAKVEAEAASLPGLVISFDARGLAACRGAAARAFGAEGGRLDLPALAQRLDCPLERLTELLQPGASISTPCRAPCQTRS